MNISYFFKFIPAGFRSFTGWLKFGLMAFPLLVLGACSDFLESEPRGEIAEENFYQNPDDAWAALVGCYDGLQRVWAGGISFPVASEVLSDNCFGGTGASDGFGYQMIDEFDRSRSPSDQNLFNDNWTAYYEAIYRCNMLLGKLDQIDWGTEEELRPVYESEARFLRAYMYFDMVRLWGRIPLLTEPSSAIIPQSDPAEVYRIIAEDLLFAVENLEPVSYSSQDPDTYGRATRWAAQALLGRVYLFYTGYYQQPDLAGVVNGQQVLAYLEDLIGNGGFGLLEDFSALWPAASLENYAGEDNRETVFAIKYTYTSDYDGNTDGNHWLVMYGIREQAIYPYGNGWGGGTVNPRLWEAYSGEDTRRSASIISMEDEGLNFTNQVRQREYTGYYIKKYTPMVDENGNSLPVNEGGTNFMIGQFQDYVAIRYADVLLMAAELGSSSAQEYFDTVRQRAYKDNFTPLPVSKEHIMQERRLEFAFEGIRYWDLLRQGVSTTAGAIAETTTVWNGGVEESKTISAAGITETQGLQQIPYSQITLSGGALQQNPGW